MKKRIFNPFESPPVKISIEQVQQLIAAYAKKNIKIYFQGDTEYGHKCLVKRNSEISKNIELLESDESIRYALYVSHCWSNGNDINENIEKYSILPLDMMKYYTLAPSTAQLSRMSYVDISQELSSSLDSKGQLVIEDMYTLNKRLRKFEALMSPAISEYIAHLKKSLNCTILTKQQAEDELCYIYQNLAKDKAVGYAYTSWKGLEYKHAEGFIIDSNGVHKVTYSKSLDDITSLSNKDVPFYKPLHCRHILEYNERPMAIPYPQAGDVECASLLLVWNSILLKRNGAAFSNSIAFHYYNHTGKIQSVFIPSPEVFKYSQSSTYNNILNEFVTSPLEHSKFNHKTSEFKILTLVGLLNQSIEKAISLGDENTQTSNLQLKEYLTTTYRAKWKELYEAMDKKRSKMTYDHTNYCLAFKTQKYDQSSYKI